MESFGREEIIIKHTQMKQCNFIILEPGCGTVYFYITFTLIRLKY